MISSALRRAILPFCILTICLALAACGDLPEPFLGNPGATARRLAKPPAPLLAIAPGVDTLLPDTANRDLANQLALALQATEVPALVRTPQKTDWRLVTRASQAGDMVVPQFSVVDPDGKEEGKAVGEAVPLADWAMASPDLMHRIAAEAAPRVGAVLTSIRIAHEKADPNSLYNRAAKVMVAEVTGAPGDGNEALTRQMRARLAVLGPVVLTTPTDADFIVKGTVAVAPEASRKERVEIQWSVQTPTGDERGRVVQLNEIPAGTLDHYWGDVAVVVATEASNGVNDVIKRQSDRETASGDQPQPTKAATETPVRGTPRPGMMGPGMSAIETPAAGSPAAGSPAAGSTVAAAHAIPIAGAGRPATLVKTSAAPLKRAHSGRRKPTGRHRGKIQTSAR